MPWAWVVASRSARVAAPDGDASGQPGQCSSFYLREIDDNTVVAQGFSGDVVPSPTDSDQKPVNPSEVNGTDDIRRVGAAGDKGGMLVDHRVPDFARPFVGFISRKKDLSLEVLFQLFNLRGL